MRKIPPPGPRLPSPPDVPTKDVRGIPDVSNIVNYLKASHRELGNELRNRTPDNQVRSLLLLMSPNGTVYQVTVSDTGVLTTTELAS